MFSSNIATKILPIINQLDAKSVLITGVHPELASALTETVNTIPLSPPFSLTQLDQLTHVDVAIVCDLTETMPKQKARQWLGLLKNKYSEHVFIITNQNKNADWHLTDFLALGFKQLASVDNYVLYYYAIESYQLKKDWLNAKYWANPENFDKYRW